MDKKFIPDIYLERYLLNELPENKKREIDKTIIENPGLKKRIEELKKSNNEILNKFQPDIFSERIKNLYNLQKQKRKATEKEQPSFFKKFIMPSFALAAIVMGFIFFQDRLFKNDIEITRLKGMQTRLYIYGKKSNKEELLKNNSSVRENDLLQLAYISTDYSYGVILSIDGRGIVTLHYPDNIQASTKLIKNKKILLKKSYELDDAPEFERFFFITSKKEINTVELIKIAETFSTESYQTILNEELKLDINFNQISITLKKE